MNITTANDGRLLLAVSFGTSFADTREKTIGAIERRIAEKYPDCTVQRCFTSRMIRKKLLERDGLKIDGPEEALQKALEKGIRELVIQPLYLMHGSEHRRLMESVQEAAPSFDRLAVGKPLLSDESDFYIMADAIRHNLPAPDPDTAVVLMGHGNGKRKTVQAESGTDRSFVPAHVPAADQDLPADRVPSPGKSFPAWEEDLQDNAVFAILQKTLLKRGADQYFVATVEGWPELGDVLSRIRERGFRKVILAPFMIVAGDHARNDLAGEDENSWKNIFARSGFRVETVLRGIGEWEEVQDLFAAHAAQCM